MKNLRHKIIKLIKKILGFDSPYSWMKWLRISLFVLAFILVYNFMFGWDTNNEAGIVGWIILIIFMGIIFAPILAVLVGITAGIGLIIGGLSSGRKQVKSLKESAASGSAEILNLDKMRLKSQLLRFFSRIAAAATGILFVIFMIATGLTIDGEAAEYGVFIVLLILSALLAGVLALGHERLKDKYNKSFKEDIVRRELESLLTDMLFEPNKSIDREFVEESQLFANISGFSGNDLLSAKYNGRQFVQSDIHITRGGSYGVKFNGRFMLFDYNTISKESVWVHDKRMKNSDGAIQTALDSFNKKFGIVSKDAVSAFRILTPQVVEGIVLASEKLKYPMSLAFLNDKIYIAIESGDTLEGATEGDATFSEQLNKVKSDVQTICDMVETLYLK